MCGYGSCFFSWRKIVAFLICRLYDEDLFSGKRVMNTAKIIASSLLILLLSVVVVFAGSGKIVARGQGIEVTGSDVKVMKRIAGGEGHPSAKSLLEGTLRMKLFAAEARQESLSCLVAEGKSGFDQDFALAQCYLEARLTAMKVKDEAV